MNKISIVISAPSGSGKTTIINRLLAEEDKFEFSISSTTRPIRENEISGESYYFLNADEFKSMIKNDEFLEWAVVHGNYYGTAEKEIDRISNKGKVPIFDVDIQGAKSLRKKIKEAVLIFIIPPSKKDLELRLKNRKTDSKEQINIRLKNSIKELKEFRHYDYVIINEKVDTAVDQIKAIITAEKCRISRVNSIVKKIVEI